MDITKTRTSTAAGRPLGISAVIAALEADEADGGGNEVQMGKAAPRIELTSDNVGMYLQGLSANSNDGIEALIDELRRLREKLVSDSGRIEHSIVEFAKLNQSIMKATKIVSDRIPDVLNAQRQSPE